MGNISTRTIIDGPAAWAGLADAIAGDNLAHVRQFMDTYGARGLLVINSPDQRSGLYWAVMHQKPKALRLMLGYPDVNANIGGPRSWGSPLMQAASGDSLECLELLLRRPEVDVNDCSHVFNPLIVACRLGKIKWVKTLIALRGHDLDVLKKVDIFSFGEPCNAFDVCIQRDQYEILTILQHFKADKVRSIRRCRRELGFVTEDVASLFALIIYLCDGFLILGPGCCLPVGRFFAVMIRLPMELQMVICNRVYGSADYGVLSVDSEKAFAKIAATI